ncbi:PLDc N-terminal domain-containing protein [Cellulomonas sp. DKR-3]|uniref:PLDc N-terminal domain-containing protein n=1 Tax=Cellulomonas fulva TaxID=2835530 RepID=A0ABS5TYK4_9CELL|nr:PLDc N-terminal domain-containing protein [Cellulomonas fulva]MBT0994225.1 PLDc N-terminal domain-containing protein [Cellulomonas fulva]
MRYLGYLLVIGLVVYCVIDIVRSTDDERLGVHPALWVLLVVLLPVLGSIVWLAVSRARRAQVRPARAGWGPSTRSAAGPSAPDDDEEFLWRLEQERKRQSPTEHPDDPPRDPTAPA